MGNSNKKKITIVEGRPGDLNISPVYTHLSVEKPKAHGPNKNIVVPTGSKVNKNKKKKKK